MPRVAFAIPSTARRAGGRKPGGGRRVSGGWEGAPGGGAPDDELRKEDDVGVRLACLLEPLDDPRCVAVEIADDAIDLCECESHRPGDPRFEWYSGARSALHAAS